MIELAAVYVQYCLGFAVRSLAIAGPLYGFFYRWRPREWAAYRIQRELPGRDDVEHEIRWSIVTMACTGVTTVLLYEAVRRGWTRVYVDAGRYGWLYLGVSVAMAILVYDGWFYWQHRLLHHGWLFRHVHAVHHRVTNPTPFANFAAHPVETLMGTAYFFLLVMIVPMHPLALAAVSFHVFAWGTIAHLGYELYPRGFTRHPAFRWLNTATFHNMHHRHVTTNYGLMFSFWDRVMRTHHPAYHSTFDAIRRSAP